MRDYISPAVFDERYLEITCKLGWSGTTTNYDKTNCVEGGFFPFARYRGKRGSALIDTGCIWIGNRYCYPKIFVDNDLAWWDDPYDTRGEVARDPFLPLYALLPIKQKFLLRSWKSRYELNKILDNPDIAIL